jgi:hypothetical protein
MDTQQQELIMSKDTEEIIIVIEETVVVDDGGAVILDIARSTPGNPSVIIYEKPSMMHSCAPSYHPSA